MKTENQHRWKFCYPASCTRFQPAGKSKRFSSQQASTDKKYEDTDVSLNLTADFSGHSIDDIQGKINLDSLFVHTPDEAGNYFLPRLQIDATQLTQHAEVKEIRIDSPFLTGSIQGKYTYHTLLKSMEKVIRKHIPSLFPEEKQKKGKKKPAELNNQFHFQFRMENSEFFSKVLNIPFDLQMPATFSGQLNDSLSQMRINGSFPQFTYNGKYYESGTLLCESRPDELRCQVRAGTLMKKGAMFNLSLLTRAKMTSCTAHSTGEITPSLPIAAKLMPSPLSVRIVQKENCTPV